MNSILFQPAECLRDLDIFTNDMPAFDDAFATIPMPSVPPAFLADQEEEVYTSFEEAISDRVLAMQRLLQTSQGRRQASRLPSTDPHWHTISESRGDARHRPVGICSFTPAANNISRLTQKWRHILLLGGLSLAMALLGFDLMGLLVLQLR